MRTGFYFYTWCGLCLYFLSFFFALASDLNSSEHKTIKKPIITGLNCNMRNLGIFYSEEEIFDILLDKRNRNRRNVSDLIRVYKEKCCSLSATNTTSNKPRRPFIVIESNYRPPRKMVAKQLTDILGGQYVSVPPNCLREFLYTFDYNAELRRAYFGLGLYAAAHEVRFKYHRGPVITSGYWSDQTSFSIAKEFEIDKIPEVGDPIYSWPKDLLKPDVSFLLTVPQEASNDGFVVTTVMPDDFQKKRLVAFRRMRRPRLREVKGVHYYDTILAQMQSKMLSVFMHPRWRKKNVRY